MRPVVACAGVFSGCVHENGHQMSTTSRGIRESPPAGASTKIHQPLPPLIPAASG